jgi:hypothetical protein
MRLVIIGTVALWIALLALIVAVNSPSGPDAGAPTPTGRAGVQRASPWRLLERTPKGWQTAQGPFGSAKACRAVSDQLNNQHPAYVFDCDPIWRRPASRRPPRNPA